MILINNKASKTWKIIVINPYPKYFNPELAIVFHFRLRPIPAKLITPKNPVIVFAPVTTELGTLIKELLINKAMKV